jgi:hypothetical protein
MYFRIPLTLVKCPRCNVAVDIHWGDLSTNLGPPAVQCRWCGASAATDRIEWREMGRRRRTWFIFISLLYLVTAFFLGGLSVTSGIQLLKNGMVRKNWGIAEPAFWIGGGFLVVTVCLVQAYRIYRSELRHNRFEPSILRGHALLDLEISGQSKMLQLLLIFPGICWIISRFKMQPLPEWTIPALVIGIGIVIGLVIGPGISRRHWAARDADERRAAAALFEVVTQNVDVSAPLRWNYVLKNIPDHRVDWLASMAKAMGFNVGTPRIDKAHGEYFMMTLSEECTHVVDSFMARLTTLDQFAKSQQFEIADCSAELSPFK